MMNMKLCRLYYCVGVWYTLSPAEDTLGADGVERNISRTTERFKVYVSNNDDPDNLYHIWHSRDVKTLCSVVCINESKGSRTAPHHTLNAHKAENKCTIEKHSHLPLCPKRGKEATCIQSKKKGPYKTNPPRPVEPPVAAA